MENKKINAKYCTDKCRDAALELRNAYNGKSHYMRQRARRKARSFDALINLLEDSNVDAATKDAIERLRDFVDGKRDEAGEVLGDIGQATANRDISGY